MNNPQPQVDVDGAVKALFAAGAKFVGAYRDFVMGWHEDVMIWMTDDLDDETRMNPQGDAPQADVVAWINAKLAAGVNWVELRIENDDIIDFVEGVFF